MSNKLKAIFKKRNYVIEKRKSFIQENNKIKCYLDVWFPLNSINEGWFGQKFSEKLIKRFPNLEPDITGEGLITQIIGVATCSSEDEFNEKTGKTLAYSKAQMKAYSIARRLLALIVNEYANRFWKTLNAEGFMKMCTDREKRFINSKL